MLIFGIIIAVIGIGALSIKGYYMFKGNKAVQIAEAYLAQKYEQEMIYENVRYSWIDPGQYHVYFTSAETKVWFGVSMWPQALEFQGTPPDEYIWDNYLDSFFCRKTEEIILPEITASWDDNSSIQVVQHSRNVYPKKNTSEINEHMTEREMEPFYNYEFYVTTSRLLNSESKMEEARRILNLFQSIQELDYHPVEILVWYQTGKDERKEVSTDSETWAKRYIKFDAWEEIDSADQVVNIMNEQWIFED